METIFYSHTKVLNSQSVLCKVEQNGRKPVCSEFRKENERRGVIRICINSSLEEFCYRGEKKVEWEGIESKEIGFWKNESKGTVLW